METFLKILFFKFFFRILSFHSSRPSYLPITSFQVGKFSTFDSIQKKIKKMQRCSNPKKDLLEKLISEKSKIKKNPKSHLNQKFSFEKIFRDFLSSIFFPKHLDIQKPKTLFLPSLGQKKSWDADENKSSLFENLKKFSNSFAPLCSRKVLKKKQKQTPKIKIENLEKKSGKGFINLSVLLKILNNITFHHELKGFSKSVLDFLVFSVNKFLKSILLSLGQISLDRQKKKKRFANEWGSKNILEKKNYLQSFYGKFFRFENDLKNSVFSFKRKKKAKQMGSKYRGGEANRNLRKSNDTKKKNRNSSVEDNISKTNKTLMALLEGILKKRNRILKEATKGLCQYKPILSKNFNRKKAKKEENSKVFPDSPKNQVNNNLDLGNYLTGVDCMNLMCNEELFFHREIFLKLFFSLGSDYNFRNSFSDPKKR